MASSSSSESTVATSALAQGVRLGGLVAASLLVATAASAILEGSLGIPDASPVYLVPVVIVASLEGTLPAIATSVLAFLVYDFLFTSPRFTLTVTDPAEWLSLLLFLLIAVVIGRLAALLRERAEIADRRSRESVAIASIAREVTMGATFEEAAAAIAERLRRDTEMTTLTIEDGADVREQGVPWTLLRSTSDESSDWVRIVDRGSAPPPVERAGGDAYLVPIEADGVRVGTIVGTRLAGEPRPGRGARRILASAADLLGMAYRRDELRDEITAGEVARQGDALRTAILDSVSHDLRTPLATIRAVAGGLLDPAAPSTEDGTRHAAAAIDQEAERLGDLVRGLLDMSRIQAGAVRPDVAAYELGELVETSVRRLARGEAAARIGIAIPDDVPPVAVDAVLFDVALSNVLDNALRYAPPPAPVVVAAEAIDDATVGLRVDDGGPGVPEEALGLLFDRFYRVAPATEHARHGLGMGLAIARGFVAAMGGSVEAAPSPLGGLRVTMRLPAAAAPLDEGTGAAEEDAGEPEGGLVEPLGRPGGSADHGAEASR